MPAHALSLVPSAQALSGPRAVLSALVRQRQEAEAQLSELNAAQQRLEAAAPEVANIEGEYSALEARKAAELRTRRSPGSEGAA